MAKRLKKSIVDLMSKTPKPEDDLVEKGVAQIHGTSVSPEPEKTKKEKTVRVTVDTPETLHKELKKIIIDQEMDLKTFYLQAVREKSERLGYKVPD